MPSRPRPKPTAAAADADRARRDLNRLLSVRREDPAAVAGKDIDAAQAALREANARLNAARETAQARRAQIAAARAQESQARGGEREVAIRVGQLSPPAPSAARVEEVFYRPGEWVAANQPVVSLLPDDRIKVRFFVPEQEVARYRPGRSVRFSCDGCAGRPDREDQLRQPAARIHPAGHLQPRQPRPAGVHGRGAARNARPA